jgi:GDP-D-mannose dehydratase
MFNHESNLRTNHFFTKKILSGILEGKNNTLEIYNTQSQRDWGYAPEFIDIILESQKHNYIGLTYLGTGSTYSVEDFIDLAFTVSGVDYEKTMIADKWVWACSNVTIKEISRNIKDSERILAADRLLVERTMGTAPTIYGQKLVQKLIHDFV